jgi:threonine dehydratase
MPATSAKVKIDAVRGFGAAVDLIDTTKISRNERVAQLAEQNAECVFGERDTMTNM